MRTRASRRCRRAVGARVLLCALALTTAACGSSEPIIDAGGKLSTSASPAVDQEGTVDLRVYLRAGEGEQAYLQPVSRRAAIAVDLPRRALELLLAGPLAEDGSDVRAPLPPETTVRTFDVHGDTAVVDLSSAAGQAPVDAPLAEHELLALAAIANTLTEFPEIHRVRLTVAGQRRLWGAWSVPETLGRDEQAIGPRAEGDALPTPARFTADPQQVGVADGGPVTIKSVRTFDRLGFVRMVVELADAGGELPAAGIPATGASLEAGRLTLRIDDVLSSGAEPLPGGRLLLEGLPFASIEAEAGELPGPVRFALPSGDRPFWLHTLSSPTRVVLDVRK